MNRKREKLLLGCHRNKSSLKGLCNHLNISEQEMQVAVDLLKEGFNFLIVLASMGLLCFLFLLIGG